jgi:uncharacterized protein YndB with AHSA1/START domain
VLRRSRQVDAATAAPAARAARAAAIPAGPVAVTVEVPVDVDQLRGWFLDPQRWTRFQGRQAWIDPVLGGRLRVEMADGVFTAGTFVEIGERHIAFTWGREGDPTMPVGSTTVTIDLHPTADGTRIELVHEGLADRSLADEHAGGWRYHLIRLGAAASGAGAEAELVDLFLAATREPDAIARRGLLERTCAPEIEVADGHDDTHGIPSLAAKLGRLVQGEPTVRLVRLGDVERVGALLRCDYALRREPDELVERGELVASVDRQHRLGAVSLFG